MYRPENARAHGSMVHMTHLLPVGVAIHAVELQPTPTMQPTSNQLPLCITQLAQKHRNRDAAQRTTHHENIELVDTLRLGGVKSSKPHEAFS